MLPYISRRLLLILPTLFGITCLVFLIVQSAPGGPVEQAILQWSEGSAMSGGGSQTLTSAALEQLNQQYHFDKPILVRYFLWLKDFIKLDLGPSIVYEQPAWEVLKSKFPVSLQFGLTSLFFTYFICIPLGISKALKDKSHWDYTTSFFLFLAHSTPGFVLGILLIVFLGGGTFLNLFPVGGLVSENYENLSWSSQILDRIHHAVLPVLCYMVSHVAMVTLLMKNSFIGEINKDYIKTAKAKGLPPLLVYYKHALRNALIPIATGLGGIFSIIFAGSLLIETVFNLDGIGLLTYTSIMKRDYTVIMASVTIHSLLILLGNLFSDIAIALVDPRIEFK